MGTEKAYKLLANQKGISNKKAKEIIDKGLVYVGDKKVKIARAEMRDDTKFRIEKVDDVEILFEDDYILAIDKPPFIESYDIAESFPNTTLLHRLDRETSGVLLLSKNEEFTHDAIEAFRQKTVVKKYIAWVEGVVFEEIVIDKPISTHKHNNKAYSKIDPKRGKPATTVVKPHEIQGKKSKIDIRIDTGRTHQIRVHLADIKHPIVGDEFYGSKTASKRILLHAKKIEILGYTIQSPEPLDIQKYK
ncbi:MAG TPA: RluA family pseudouridine synthase [Epsilonproteobacteria bacterium]|nr:RluA family pseudouridine synthase [Campylobacterota bacterium]